jgi:hypothetical protein
MAFSTTNSISFSQLKNKLNGGTSIKLSDYFQNSSTNYSKLIQNIPTIGSSISLSVFRGKSPVKIFNAIGTNQTLTIPTGTTRIFVKAWGAGGGGQYGGTIGGAGGFSSGYIQVNSGEVITIKVGNKGKTSTGAIGGSYPDGGESYGGYSGTGGGSSSVWRNGASDASIVAGGGGGGGSSKNPGTENDTWGGSGGGLNGVRGREVRTFEFGGWQAVDNGVGHFSGFGGTQTQGGNRGGNCSYWYYQQASLLPSSGSKYKGGYVNQAGGGSGGGGYYGGGGGGNGDYGSAAGGGGSGYVGGCLLITNGAPSNPTTLSSSLNSPPPNNTDFHYVSNIGIGGAGSTDGGNGYIVIMFAN